MTAQIAAYGRLGRDPRQHETKSGKPMASASLAVTVEARERGADDAEGTLWLTVLAFGRVADELARHSAGDPVSVSGRLQLSRYVTNDGEAREGWQVIADSVVSSRSVRPGGGRRKGGGGEVRDRRGAQPRRAVRRCLIVLGTKCARPGCEPVGGRHERHDAEPVNDFETVAIAIYGSITAEC